jgi:hypothetical protein
LYFASKIAMICSGDVLGSCALGLLLAGGMLMNLDILIEFFKNQALLYLNPVVYSSLFVARVTYRLFKSLDFQPAQVLNFLEKAGKRLKTSTVNAICKQAQKGVDHLEIWIQAMLEDLDVNELTTEILANQTKVIGESFDQAELEKSKRQGLPNRYKLNGANGRRQLAIAPAISSDAQT